MKVKSLTILFVVILVVGFALYWLSSHAYIEVTVANGSDGQYKYIVTSNSPEPTSTVSESNEKKYRILVRRGEHQITVMQDSLSYFAHVSVGGFLSTTEVSASLSPEKSRTFKGDNPNSCIDAIKGVVVSWVCRHRLDLLKYHSIASKTTPSSTKPIHDFSDPEYVKSVFSVEDQNYVLTRASDIEELYLLGKLEATGGKISLTRDVVLSDLSIQKDYRIIPYKTGLLVYGLDGTEFLYYKTLTTSPETFSQLTENNEQMGLYSVSTRGDAIVATYNNTGATEDPGVLRVSPSNVHHEEHFGGSQESDDHDEGSEIVVFDGDDIARVSLDSTPQQVRLCGDNLLCTLENRTLEVYRLSGDSIDRQYTVEGVDQIEEMSNRLYVVNSFGVMEFDPISRSGYYQYTFGGYSFCGIKSLGSNYLLCVNENSNSSRSSHVLLIDTQKDGQGEVDKQVLELAKLTEIKAIAPYNNLIHLSVDVGELIQDADGKLTYNPETVKRVNKVINDRINELGINLKKYTVINPFD